MLSLSVDIEINVQMFHDLPLGNGLDIQLYNVRRDLI